jgi:hypothetical protein
MNENYIQGNLKKFSSASEIEHNTRSQNEGKDLLKVEDRLENLIDKNSKKRFNELKKKASEEMKKRKTGWKKKSLPNIDMVVSMNEEQHLKNIEEFGITKYNEMIKTKLEQYGKLVEEKLGIKFVSVNIHNDEGHYKNGKLKYNFHSHLNFLDFDFKTNKMVMSNQWRPYTKKSKKAFSELQTELANLFSDLGFVRGKENSTAEHIESKEYKKVQDKLNNEIQELENEIEELTLEELQDLKIKYKDNKLKKRLVDYVYRFKKAEQEQKDKTKSFNNILKTWEKIQADNLITPKEQKDFMKMLNTVGAKSKAKSVSKMTTKK